MGLNILYNELTIIEKIKICIIGANPPKIENLADKMDQLVEKNIRKEPGNAWRELQEHFMEQLQQVLSDPTPKAGNDR